MIIKFVTLPESNCQPGKQSWADVARLLKSKIVAKFSDNVEFQHIEFMSNDWFNDIELIELSDKMEINFPLVIINNEIFSNGSKINISKILKDIEYKL